MNYQIIAFTLGCLLTVLGVMEFLPAMLDLYDGNSNANSFFLCSVVSIFFGGSMIIANKDFRPDVTVRQAFLLTSLSWLFMTAFAALPLYISDLPISYTDAFFEAMSGITTTGSTVLVGLDKMSRGILLWRSLTQLLGGIGVVAFAIILLPYLKIGGMQLFRTESSSSEKALTRATSLISLLIYTYLGLTALCAILYKVFGMSWFDAVNHAMATLSTGGYSTHDSSFGYFSSPALDLICVIFMTLGGLPFILYIKLVFQRQNRFLQDEQFRVFLAMIVGITVLGAVWLWTNSDYTVFESFRYVGFNVVSVLTTTGFANTDYMTWGPFMTMLFFFITYLGACTGSTSGGLKVMRIIILGRVLTQHLKTLLYPHGVFTARYQGHALAEQTSMTVLGFMGLYVVSNVALTAALTFTGVDFTTAVSGAAAAIANVGPGAGVVIGPDGNFSSLNDTAKWLLSLGMLLGRLEILTLAVLFLPRYWR